MADRLAGVRTGEGPRNEKSGKPLNLRENPSERQSISEILKQRAAGASYLTIAERLTTQGNTYLGRRWNHQTIVKICGRADEVHRG